MYTFLMKKIQKIAMNKKRKEKADGKNMRERAM